MTQMVKLQESESMHRITYQTLEEFIPGFEWRQGRIRRAGGKLFKPREGQLS
jgi:hypothetical protein